MEILNTQRFDAIKILFKQKNINLSIHEIEIYSNVFEIISQFVHGKLSNEEILAVYDLLSDVIKNARPDIAVHVPREDRIRVQVRLMEELPETKGKLDEEEKIAFAYCIYTCVCVQVYDEERDKMCNGIVLFDTFEHIKSELEYERQQFPSRFKIENNNAVFDSTYGYSIDNPINATSVGAAYDYLRKLRYNALPVTFERIGSFSNHNNNLIDGYDIFTEKKGLFKNKKIKVATIYINSYCYEMPKIAPKGFVLI